jgi:hypothetical protein
MDNIPKYSNELLEQLDLLVEAPKFPDSAQRACNLTESEIRRGIWMAAQRALVDSLLQLQEEGDETQSDSGSPSTESGSLLDTPVLDPSGKVRTDVASVYMASTRASADADYER